MLYYFDREDVCTLWRIYKERFGAKKFEAKKNGKETFDYIKSMSDNVLWRALKLMFDPSM